MMSSVAFNSLPPLSSFASGCALSKPKTPRFLQVRSQSFRDEGKPIKFLINSGN